MSGCKLVPMYVAKIAVRKDNTLTDGSTIVNLSLPFETTKFNGKTKEYDKVTTWVNATIFPDKVTKELPKITPYLTVGKVVGVVGELQVETFNKADGSQGSKLMFVYPQFHFIPNSKEEDPYADGSTATEESATVPANPFAPAVA